MILTTMLAATTQPTTAPALTPASSPAMPVGGCGTGRFMMLRNILIAVGVVIVIAIVWAMLSRGREERN